MCYMLNIQLTGAGAVELDVVGVSVVVDSLAEVVEETVVEASVVVSVVT